MNPLNFRLLFVFAIVFSFSFAQENSAENNQEDTNESTTLVDDLETIVDASGSYQEYKVIEKTKLAAYKKSLAERIDEFQSEISSLNAEIKNQQEEIIALQSQLDDTKNNLTKIETERDQILFFGAPMQKAAYQTTMWAIIGVLALVLIIFLLKYRSNHQSTKEIKENIKRVESDFEEYKRNALEKQQKLGRELQDEKNKVSKLKGNKPS
ncbi:MAG: hypothetical protein ACQESK_05080 [Bacteroidota bacterium]